MSGFSSKWLALREPVDLHARNRSVEAAFIECLPEKGAHLMDLASGAGSTIAALGNRIPVFCDWFLTDYDEALLEVAESRWGDNASRRVSSRRIDLANSLEELPFPEVDAITTSAFLDLVSEGFLQRLVSHVVEARKPLLASLSYDGRAEFLPKHHLDESLRHALNEDQRTDKGFGRALGPDAAARAMELFEARGYRVVQGSSDWRAGSSSKEFLSEFLSGWLKTGRAFDLDKHDLEVWQNDRFNQIQSGQLEVVIGHIDFAALPK